MQTVLVFAALPGPVLRGVCTKDLESSDARGKKNIVLTDSLSLSNSRPPPRLGMRNLPENRFLKL